MLGALRFWHADGDGRILAVTVMPDHVHVLSALGHKLTVGRCVTRWIAEIRRRLGYAVARQRDFWEHQLRICEPWEDYGLYIFLNPYRANLAAPDQERPWWWSPDPGLSQFTGALDSCGAPPTEWLAWPAERFGALATGESAHEARPYKRTHSSADL